MMEKKRKKEEERRQLLEDHKREEERIKKENEELLRRAELYDNIEAKLIDDRSYNLEKKSKSIKKRKLGSIK